VRRAGAPSTSRQEEDQGQRGVVRLDQVRAPGRHLLLLRPRPRVRTGFIKICTYFPYPAKVWLNGHEWAKRQARRARLRFDALSNGLAACPNTAKLQAICDQLGPADVQGFFGRWISKIPTPFSTDDRDAGSWWELSMRHVEVSRTLVFDDPRRARRVLPLSAQLSA
jgi:hypothetical protein